MTTLNTISIKGKKYVTVNERLKYFRETQKGYSIETEVVSIDADSACLRAIIRDEQGRLIATGLAREVRTDAMSMVNKTSFVENCETSAWGRALANFGIGIDENVASADEVVMAIATRATLDEPKLILADEIKEPKKFAEAEKLINAAVTKEELQGAATTIKMMKFTKSETDELRKFYNLKDKSI